MSSFSSTVILCTRSAPLVLAVAITILTIEPGNLNLVMGNSVITRFEPIVVIVAVFKPLTVCK
jgi:hypothetical protein